jgi:uncharacterized protein
MPSAIAARLQQDVITAMKARDRDRLGVLRQLQAALKQVEVDERRELDDAAVIKVLQSYAKKVRDTLASAEAAGRAELAAEAQTELDLVTGYLPAALSDEELAALVDKAIAAAGATDIKQMGQVMQAVMREAAGRAEGSRISALVKSRLAG